MSIEEAIHWRVEEGRLFPLLPKAAGATPRRAMFLSGELWDLLRFEHEDQDLEERLGILQADLEFFVTSKTIDPKYLFHLYPPRDACGKYGACDQIRLFGSLAYSLRKTSSSQQTTL